MGRGIATCLLGNGYEVSVYTRTSSRAKAARPFIGAAIADAVRRKVLAPARTGNWQERLRIVTAPDGLADCPMIVESISEDLAAKRRLYAQLERAVSPASVIASNTSSFPIDLLNQRSRHPGRFVVMHWAEPAWISRFVEIVRGKKTSAETMDRASRLALGCGKQPCLLSYDVRGFIANRLMYAFLIEACRLADLGVADVATIDRAFSNDTGWWAAIAGPFRWMDLTGIPAYATVMKGLLPELTGRRALPRIMASTIASGARGVANRRGFYRYDAASAKAWEEVWVDFTYDMRSLVMKHEKRITARSGPRAPRSSTGAAATPPRRKQPRP